MASKGHKDSSLLTDMYKPENILKQDDHVVIINDKHPKSKHHYLVLPKVAISTLTDLNASHIGLLKHMSIFAKEYIEGLSRAGFKGLDFRMGYHAIPSVRQLHLHVISTDFQGAGLKTKKHWNSFTTEYFVSTDLIVKHLESYGKVNFDKSKYSDILHTTPLKCHMCHKVFAKMPHLKDHVSKCKVL